MHLHLTACRRGSASDRSVCATIPDGNVSQRPVCATDLQGSSRAPCRPATGREVRAHLRLAHATRPAASPGMRRSTATERRHRSPNPEPRRAKGRRNATSRRDSKSGLAPPRRGQRARASRPWVIETAAQNRVVSSCALHAVAQIVGNVARAVAGEDQPGFAASGAGSHGGSRRSVGLSARGHYVRRANRATGRSERSTLARPGCASAALGVVTARA